MSKTYKYSLRIYFRNGTMIEVDCRPGTLEIKGFADDMSLTWEDPRDWTNKMAHYQEADCIAVVEHREEAQGG